MIFLPGVLWDQPRVSRSAWWSFVTALHSNNFDKPFQYQCQFLNTTGGSEQVISFYLHPNVHNEVPSRDHCENS